MWDQFRGMMIWSYFAGVARIVELIPSPWQHHFSDLISGSKRLDFMSPFVTTGAVNHLLKLDLRIRGITLFDYQKFMSRSSDLDAIEDLLNIGAEMRSLRNLHAKVFITDRSAVITSSNLTKGGLTKNIEYGIEINKPEMVDRIRADFCRLYQKGIRISKNRIHAARGNLERIDDDQRVRAATSQEIQIVIDSLRGWMREIFIVIRHFDDEFTLEDVYAYEDQFSKIYPRNKHISEKIRQTLQYLRDSQLIDFIDYRGGYRKHFD